MSNLVERIEELARLSVKYVRTITDDEEALKVKHLYKKFNKQIGKELKVGEYIQHEGVLYKVLAAHTCAEHWQPADAPSLFAKVLISLEGEVLDWVQPDSTNAYMKGDKVRFEEKVYESTIDNNVWSPSANPAGWKEVVEK